METSLKFIFIILSLYLFQTEYSNAKSIRIENDLRLAKNYFLKNERAKRQINQNQQTQWWNSNQNQQPQMNTNNQPLNQINTNGNQLWWNTQSQMNNQNGNQPQTNNQCIFNHFQNQEGKTSIIIRIFL